MPNIAGALFRQAARPAARNLSRVAGERGVQAATRQAAKQTSEALNPAFRQLLDQPSLHNHVSFHVSLESSHRALLDSIQQARHSFYIETFIWHDDQEGREVADALIRRKQEVEAAGGHFDARVLIDWIGLKDGANDHQIIGYLRRHGINVKVFSPGYLNLDAMRIAPLTHRKLYIQDGTQFMTGGRNIGDEYELPTYEVGGVRELSWNDMLFTVKGDETHRVIDRFFSDWKKAGGRVPARANWPKAQTAAPRTRVPMQTIVTDPYTRTTEILQKHMQAIAAAKKEIVAIYPYFSDDDLINALLDAKKKNPALRVRVMMPSFKEPSESGALYSTLNRETARRLLNGGVEVRWFGGGELRGKPVARFSHMKGLAIDGELLSIGSGNADARTYRDNHELNTLIHDRATARRYMQAVVEPEWAESTPATIADLNKDSLWERIKQKVLRFFEFLM